MTSIEWKAEYSVHDEEIDEHHKQLIRYIQVLDDPATRHKADEDFVALIVDGLAEYTVYHFAAEEKKMVESGYPDLAAHRAEHADFALDVEVFRRTFGEGSPRLEKALLGYLKDWLLTHILSSDMHVGDWLSQHATPDQDEAR